MKKNEKETRHDSARVEEGEDQPLRSWKKAWRVQASRNTNMH